MATPETSLKIITCRLVSPVLVVVIKLLLQQYLGVLLTKPRLPLHVSVPPTLLIIHLVIIMLPLQLVITLHCPDVASPRSADCLSNLEKDNVMVSGKMIGRQFVFLTPAVPSGTLLGAEISSIMLERSSLVPSQNPENI